MALNSDIHIPEQEKNAGKRPSSEPVFSFGSPLYLLQKQDRSHSSSLTTTLHCVCGIPLYMLGIPRSLQVST